MKLQFISSVVFLIFIMSLPSAYSFNPDSFNMTLIDAQKIPYVNYNIITLTFTLFNNGNQDAVLTGHSMMYLNDTIGDYWEYSNYLDLDNYSSSDCPYLETFVSSYSSNEIKLCYLTSNEPDLGYSLILNDNRYFKDSNTKEFVLESVPNWFKSTAGFWCSDVITDSDFVSSVQFYIQDGIINVLRGQSEIDAGATIPAWVKSNACLWSDNQLSDYEFLDGIYWLIDNGKVQI